MRTKNLCCRKLCEVGLLAVLLAVCVSYGQGNKDRQAVRPKYKNAATPEEAVKSLAEAAAAGDIDGYLAQLEEPSREVMKAFVAWYDASEAYLVTLARKYGKNPAAESFPTFKDFLASWKSTEIIGKEPERDGQVLLKTKLTIKSPDGTQTTLDDKLTAIKQGHTWKLRLWNIDPGPDAQSVQAVPVDAQEARQRVETLQKWTTTIEKITQEIKEGKYKTRLEAEMALTNAQRKLVPKPMAPPITASEGQLGWVVRAIGLAGIVAALLAYFKFRRRQPRHKPVE